MSGLARETSCEQDEEDSSDVEEGLQVELVAPGINEVPKHGGNSEANDAAQHYCTSRTRGCFSTEKEEHCFEALT